MPFTWVSGDGWLFELVPGTEYVLCTRDPHVGVWAMGMSAEECRLRYDELLERLERSRVAEGWWWRWDK